MHLIYVTRESCYENDFTLSAMQLQRAIILDVIGAFTESQLSCSAARPRYRHKAFLLFKLAVSYHPLPILHFLSAAQSWAKAIRGKAMQGGNVGPVRWDMNFYSLMINNIPELHL